MRQLQPAHDQEKHRSPTDGWQETDFGKLTVLSRNNLPVSLSRNQDQTFVEIADEVEKIIKQNLGGPDQG